MSSMEGLIEGKKQRTFFEHNGKVIGFYTDIGSMWFASQVIKNDKGKLYFPNDCFCISDKSQRKVIEEVIKAHIDKERRLLEAKKAREAKHYIPKPVRISSATIAVKLNVSMHDVILATRALGIEKINRKYNYQESDIKRIEDYLDKIKKQKTC